jgi:ABC-type glycerol-3-phosphate transport system substrate-binding protein
MMHVLILALLCCLLPSTACSLRDAGALDAGQKPLVIWTNRIELVSYAEFFNASQDKAKAIVVYKESPAQGLLQLQDELPPDLVIGPGLKNLKIPRYFRPVDYLFTERQLNQYAFYPQLLELGAINRRQYILPVSFNLPMVIFDSANHGFIPEDYRLTLDQIQEAAAAFTVKNNSGYTAMGFAPGWEPEFLYLAAKLSGARFRSGKGILEWDAAKLEEALGYVRDWTLRANTGTEAEQDFAFRYLYTPGYKQVTSGKSLFHYTTSGNLLSLSKDQLEKIDFRWVYQDQQVPIEDSGIFLGIVKKSKNPAAEIFVSWFMNEATQQLLMERSAAMQLNTLAFGITGGFSALRPVTERVFPAQYPLLLGNIPSPDYITPPEVLPAYWNSVKAQAVLPYLQSAVNTRNQEPPQSLETLLNDWGKQFF